MIERFGIAMIVLFSAIACTNHKTEGGGDAKDSLSYAEPSEASAPTTTLSSPDTTLVAEDLISEHGESVLEISSTKLPLSNPYDFKLDAEKIKSLLGPNATMETQKVAVVDDNPGYTMYTINDNNARIKFASDQRSHNAEIQTRALRLKNGITVGMLKESFVKKMSIENSAASKATLFKLYDDYGFMNFYFKSDTLNLIKIEYAKGE